MAQGHEVYGLGCYLQEGELRSLLANFLNPIVSRMVESVGPGEFFLEKTPIHALWLPEIHELLPRARVIHILRDGRDAVASTLAAARGWGSEWAPRDAYRASRIWKTVVQTVRATQSILPAEQFVEVRYEDLLRDPLPTLRSCTQMMGLEWSDEEIRAAVELNRADRMKADTSAGTPIPLHGAALQYGRDRVISHEGEKPGRFACTRVLSDARRLEVGSAN